MKQQIYAGDYLYEKAHKAANEYLEKEIQKRKNKGTYDEEYWKWYEENFRETYAESYIDEAVTTLVKLVKRGVLSTSDAADSIEISEDLFLKLMDNVDDEDLN